MILELVIGCLKVFFCRILDVSLGSLRTVLMVKEKTLLSGLIGFVEVFIWYIVVRDAINFDGPVLAIACSYAGGYALGTYIGGTLAKKLISGTVTVHIVTTSRDENIPKALREAGYGITVLNVNGSEYGEEKYLMLAELDKRDLSAFEERIKELDPTAFMIVQETKAYLGGYRYRRPGK